MIFSSWNQSQWLRISSFREITFAQHSINYDKNWNIGLYFIYNFSHSRKDSSSTILYALRLMGYSQLRCFAHWNESFFSHSAAFESMISICSIQLSSEFAHQWIIGASFGRLESHLFFENLSPSFEWGISPSDLLCLLWQQG